MLRNSYGILNEPKSLFWVGVGCNARHGSFRRVLEVEDGRKKLGDVILGDLKQINLIVIWSSI